MPSRELYDTIAKHVAEELKTLKEVLLMKPTVGDPKRPIDSGDVPGMPLETKPVGPHFPKTCKPIRF